jgi:hypothetical protein
VLEGGAGVEPVLGQLWPVGGRAGRVISPTSSAPRMIIGFNAPFARWAAAVTVESCRHSSQP